MLDTLRLTNFRRHIDTEIDLSDGAQIVAITGRNGAGKSSMLEAITYAFYGETRHGRRGLSTLVRRGAEFEGMQVDLGFTIGDVTYNLVRRYENGKSSARLMANGNVIMQTPDGVTGEVTRILGMDSQGFRLSVIAQQFDVDGLADLQPTKRKATITRLLRQDAITRAAIEARNMHNQHLDIWRSMGSGPDLEALQAELEAETLNHQQAQEAVTGARAALAEVDAELAATADVESSWAQAQMTLARAEATHEAAGHEVSRLERSHAGVRVPDAVDVPARDAASITAELSELNVALARAESARALADSAAATRSDLQRAQAQATALETSLNGRTPASLAMELVERNGALEAAEESLSALRREYEQAQVERGAATGALRAVESRDARVGQLGEVCPTCDQEVSAEHVEQMREERAAEHARLLEQLAALDASDQARTEQMRQAQAMVAQARTARDALLSERASLDGSMRTLADLRQRQEQYRQRLERLDVPEELVDLEPLYARKGELEVERAHATQSEALLAARRSALAQREQLEAELVAARARLDQARAAVTDAEPAADLVAAHATRSALRARRGDEAELTAALEVELATAVERVASVNRAMATASETAQRARTHREAADRAAKAAQLLTETAQRMSTLIKPALQGEISTILQQLSEGRFTAVKVSDDYAITVEDDGTYQPLSEFSGGERVLIALATRLALANVVAGRHGAGGVGFLILDEVFGSQDSERREAILSGLRGLRSMFGQILLISHVGGLEESADKVLEVHLETQDDQRVAEVTAA